VNPTTSTDGVLKLLVRVWKHLSRRRQRQHYMVFSLMLFSAITEVASLGAVLPFLGALTAPEKVFNHPLAADMVQVLGITSADQLAFPLTIAFITAAFIAGLIRMLLLWISTRLAYASGTELSVAIYQRTLYQPYSMHISRNSSQVISGVIHKASQTSAVLAHSLRLIICVLSIIAIMSTLIAINPAVALITGLGFGISYGLVTWMVRGQLKLNSQRIAQKNTQAIKALQEGLGGIRDVLLDGTQQAYYNVYRQAEYSLKRAGASNVIISGCPRFVMEVLGITLIAVLAYGLSRQVGGLSNVMPTLGALALGTQRILPALQQGFSAWSDITGSHASLCATIDLLDQPLPAEALQTDIAPLYFNKTLCFDNVSFRYSNNSPLVLENLNLTIQRGSRVGLVGTTGSGKSTTLDLLMGLLKPTEGKFLIDGKPLEEKDTRSWQKTIAHVPQSIFLSDSTIAENIAFGIPIKKIDMKRVKHAARRAQIASFIEGRTEGYEAIVGEHGIRLSGGQRQRIGIARALYKQANVLVFDEATSALDNTTEQSLMKALEGLSRDLTILLIAHRITSLKYCDAIVELEHGKVVAQGTYEQLCESSRSFRRMNQS
jgi:ATP-binding cassette, subfamily B, bacterial PglK